MSGKTNIEIVHTYYNLAINEGKVTEAADRYLAKDYRQHNPALKPGRAGFIEYFTGFFRQFPNIHITFDNWMGADDRVAVVVHWACSNSMASVNFKTIDIFRLENGIIVEHWDSVQGNTFKDKFFLLFQRRAK